MADALRAIREVIPAFADAARLHLVENSPVLRAAQEHSLGAAVAAGTCWHDGLESLPPGPVILLANEFLDALPIRQFEREGGRWRERWVEDGRFVLRDAEDAPAEDPAAPLPDGTVQERCEPALAVAATLARRLAEAGGVALFLDYGTARGGTGDSLQAVRQHAPVDPLRDPGEVDITAHVDFAAVGRAAREAGATTHGPLSQGMFLRRIGIGQRAAMLAQANPRQGAAHMAALHRLTASEAMGELFQALAISPPGFPLPPGFANA